MKLKVSNGNTKVGKDTFIMNITSATDCPTKKLGLCKIVKVCYALQPELRWCNKIKNILRYRRQQTKMFDTFHAKKLAELLIEKARSKRKTEIKYLRVSETGDFRSQADVKKISTIADILKEEEIKVYGYTARSDLNFENLSDNLVMNGSGFMLDNNFVAVKEYSGNAAKCKQNCRICNLCKQKNGLTIEVPFHGVAFNYLKRRKR